MEIDAAGGAVVGEASVVFQGSGLFEDAVFVVIWLREEREDVGMLVTWMSDFFRHLKARDV